MFHRFLNTSLVGCFFREEDAISAFDKFEKGEDKKLKAKTRIRRSIRAISPVISVLLMIAIAVAASLVAYAWMMGYIGGTTTKTGKAVLIQSMAIDTGADPVDPADDKLIVYVQNVGQGSVTINSVYVDDVLRSFTPDPNFADNKLPEGKTASLKVDYVVPGSGQVKVKVVTSEGVFTESKAIISGQGPSGSLNIIPTVAFSFSPTEPETGQLVTFTDASFDSDGTVVAWAWTFGDGGTSTAQNPTYSYASANTYTVRLTVTDDDGATNYVEHVVPVGLPSSVLDHFDFETISSQTADVVFGVTITAKDQYGATFSYGGSGTLSDLTGTISPTGVTFAGGVATPSVTITTARTDDTITVDAGGKTKTSNAFDVSNPPAVLDHFEFDTITSPKTSGADFSITIRAMDQYDAPFDGFTGTVSLSAKNGGGSSIVINPTTSGTFTNPSNGIWAGLVKITDANTGVTITATDSGSGATGYSNSFDVEAAAPTQRQVSFAQTGSGATVTVSYQIDGGSVQTGDCPFSVLVNEGQTISYTYPDPVNGAPGVRYVISTAASPASPQTVGLSDISVSATYKTQYRVTFAQAGLSTDATGTVVTVAGAAKTYGDLPVYVWVDASTGSVTYSYTATVTSSVTGKQYVKTSTDSSPVTGLSGPVTVTGVYKTQWRVTFAVSGSGTTDPSGTNVWEDAGTLSISATANSGNHFTSWSATAGITITSPTSASTTANIGASGTITANFAVNTPVTIPLRPNAAGDTTQLDRNTGSYNWQCVDEDPSDEGSTYVQGDSDDHYQTDTYKVADQSLSGTITNVRIYIRCEASSSHSSVSAETAIRLGSGTIAYGTTYDLSTSWTTYYEDYATKPSELGGGSWTWQNINDLQIGVSLRSQYSSFNWYRARCTQVWVEITYTPS